MNFLPATPVRDDGKLLLVATDNSFRIQVPQGLWARLDRSGAKQVDLGIRPIHLEVVEQPTSSLEEINATVSTFESLGEEGQLAATVGGSTVLAVTSPLLHLARKDPVKLRLRPDRIHLFDTASQAAI